MSWDSASCFYGLPMDNRQLDVATMREVGIKEKKLEHHNNPLLNETQFYKYKRRG